MSVPSSAGGGRVREPSVRVHQVGREAPEQPPQSPGRLRIREWRRVVLVGVLRDPAHPAAQIPDPVDAYAVELLDRRELRLPGGDDLDRVASRGEVPGQQLEAANRAADHRAVVVRDDQRAQPGARSRFTPVAPSHGAPGSPTLPATAGVRERAERQPRELEADQLGWVVTLALAVLLRPRREREREAARELDGEQREQLRAVEEASRQARGEADAVAPHP